jgi:hypothetical protein
MLPTSLKERENPCLVASWLCTLSMQRYATSMHRFFLDSQNMWEHVFCNETRLSCSRHVCVSYIAPAACTQYGTVRSLDLAWEAEWPCL